LNRGLRGKALASLVFLALWLDGSFYPLILLPLLFVLLYERDSLSKIGLGGSGLRRSLLLGAGVGTTVSAVYYPIFVHYLSRRMWDDLGLLTLFTDIVWYPLYEEVAYRGFFLGSFADPGEELSGRNLALNLVQALLFVLMHQNHIRAGLWLLLIPVFALGFAMGLVFIRTRNIAGCVLGHSLVNGIADVFRILTVGV
jgi:membrane protease YdiL (CAAX protease family)